LSGVAGDAVGSFTADGADGGRDAPMQARAIVGAGGTAIAEGTKP
jgi:hypothetical protein